MHARILALFACTFSAFAQVTNLPATKPLTMQGDLSAQMVAGIDKFLLDQTKKEAAARTKYWHRDFSTPEAYERSIQTNRSELRRMLGAIYPTAPAGEFEFVS